MRTVLFVRFYILIGLLAWLLVTIAYMRLVEQVGGRIGELIRMGDEGLIGLAYLLIAGAALGSIINGCLGAWAAGVNGGTADHGYYFVAGTVILGVPVVVLGFLLALTASYLS